MSDQKLVPNQELGTFSGPDGESFALIASRSGRSIAVRAKGCDGPVSARIWYPLSGAPRVEVEDRWRARGAGWISSFRASTLEALETMLPSQPGDRDIRTQELTPSSLLGTFQGPGGRNQFYMLVSRTGRTVTARLGDEKGAIVARARRPTSARPGIVFQDLHRDNPPEWKAEFGELFAAGIRKALEAGEKAAARAEGSSV